jgi:hypothetical protein
MSHYHTLLNISTRFTRHRLRLNLGFWYVCVGAGIQRSDGERGGGDYSCPTALSCSMSTLSSGPSESPKRREITR